MNLEIITTEDGSNTLRNPELDETYHSIHGAIRESRHVFIENGLKCFIGVDKHEISIFEVGFGTGLNAVLTLEVARAQKQMVRYTTIEPFPLPENIWSILNYPQTLSNVDDFYSIHRSQWQVGTTLDPYFELFKMRSTLQEFELEAESFDLVYFDAFAPSKQPQLWEPGVLEKVVTAIKPGGILVTYCAKGLLKRDLKALHMTVETLSGPPGKKEMVRARKT